MSPLPVFSSHPAPVSRQTLSSVDVAQESSQGTEAQQWTETARISQGTEAQRWTETARISQELRHNSGLRLHG
ncbi:hypothetical protein V1264_011848 [Littorina saxatilis]|uniref:Uncharacterized protein n=1 Tax=Littorina saxatilis TaxID=31220 RepID=A0AAN9GKY3_9CAEN